MLQFTNLNIQIINSVFSNLQGTPYLLVFNSSQVEFVNTKFTGNTGACMTGHWECEVGGYYNGLRPPHMR